MSVGDVRRCDVRWAERIARTMANEVNSEPRDTHKRVVTLLVPTRPGYATFLVASGHSFEGSHQGCMRGAESGFGVRLFGFRTQVAVLPDPSRIFGQASSSKYLAMFSAVGL